MVENKSMKDKIIDSHQIQTENVCQTCLLNELLKMEFSG